MADKNGDGHVDFSEFIRHHLERQGGDGAASGGGGGDLRKLRREFRRSDANRDGRISREEFRLMAESSFEDEQR